VGSAEPLAIRTLTQAKQNDRVTEEAAVFIWPAKMLSKVKIALSIVVTQGLPNNLE
jgi:hypothetical protein